MHEQIHRTMQEQIQRKSTDKSIQTIIICFSPPCTFINDKLAAIRLSGGWVSIIIADESPTHLSQRLISHAWTFVNLKKRHKSIWGDKNWRVNRRKDGTKSVSINLFCFHTPQTQHRQQFWAQPGVENGECVKTRRWTTRYSDFVPSGDKQGFV